MVEVGVILVGERRNDFFREVSKVVVGVGFLVGEGGWVLIVEERMGVIGRRSCVKFGRRVCCLREIVWGGFEI